MVVAAAAALTGCGASAVTVPTAKQIDVITNFGTEGDDFARSVAYADDGSWYLTGYFAGETEIDGWVIRSEGNADGFLASYDAEDNLKWVQRFGGTGDNHSDAVAIGPDGSVYLTGYFTGEFSFAGRTTIAQGTDGFVLKFTADGEPEWVEIIGGPGKAIGLGLAVDDTGAAYVAGYSENGIDAGGITRAGHGGIDGYLAKFDAAGTAEWVELIGGSEYDAAVTVALDREGNPSVGGWFNATATVGDFKLVSRGLDDAFIARFYSDGKVADAQAFGGPGIDYLRGLHIDPTGTIHAAGYFEDTFEAGMASVSSAGSSDGFYLRIDPDGEMKVERFGGVEAVYAFDVDVDSAGKAYVTGRSYGPVASGDNQVSTISPTQVFVAAFDVTGPVGLSGFASTDTYYSVFSTLTPAGAVRVAGYFDDSAVQLAGERSVGGKDVLVVDVDLSR